MNWQRLQLPNFSGQLLGFSLPTERKIAVISVDGIHIITLTRPPVVHDYPEFAEGGDMYDRKGQVLEFQGRRFSMLGREGGEPRGESSFGEQIHFDEEEWLTVRDAMGREVLTHLCLDSCQGWRVATFTPENDLLICGWETGLELFWRVRTLSPMVVSAAESLFPGASSKRAVAQLLAASGSERVHLAILALSFGEANIFDSLCAKAHADFRDVVHFEEYPDDYFLHLERREDAAAELARRYQALNFPVPRLTADWAKYAETRRRARERK